MKITWIEDGLLAASSVPIGQTDLRWLREQGIGAILTLTENPLTTQTNVDAELFDALDIVYCHAPILDGEPPDRETAQMLLNFLGRCMNRDALHWHIVRRGSGGRGRFCTCIIWRKDTTLRPSKSASTRCA